MRAPRKSAPAVKNGRVQKKNNWELSASSWAHDLPFPVRERERPGAGFRHLLLQRNVEKFIGLLPDWNEMSRGLSSIVLARGEWGTDGWHSPSVAAICAWEAELWIEHSTVYFEDHRALFERLDVPHERKSKGSAEHVECRWTEETARAFQLLHIFLHELGHHHDRMTTRSQKRTARGEPFAEAYALKHEALIWDRYARLRAVAASTWDNATNFHRSMTLRAPALASAALLLAAAWALTDAVSQAAPKRASSVAYLSNGRWAGVKNGWGPVEKNSSNGEKAAGDGHTLSMHKKKYRSGFGCHAPSEVRVDVGGRYSTFLADIGFDDEARYPKPPAYVTRVIFKVFADGRQVFDSGPMSAKSATKRVRVPIKGAKLLRLVVAAIGAAPSGHIDWADARASK